jgi:hypothetical protein
MRRSTEGQLMSLISLGDGSTLTLDFTTGVLDPRLTFTRASGGTYVANDGYIYGMDFATSSSLAIGTGSKSVTLTATASVDRRYLVGQTVYISNGANNMSGPVTAYNASTQVLTINATATSGSGSFTAWSVGNASPRFDHDPTTRAPKGLLIEATATNLASNSETFPTSGTGLWAYEDVTANATKITAPDGTANAIQFNETTANNVHRIGQSVSGSAGAVSVSVWVKVLQPGTPRRLFINANTFMNARGLFDIDPAVQTGASGTAVSVTGTAANRAGTWIKYPNDWYRCTLIGTYSTASTVYFQINRASSSTATDDIFAGSTTNGLAIWGAQVEAGSGASSYIPTGASTVQRLADSCVMTGTNFSSWFAGATEGVLYAECERPRKIESPAADHAIVGTRYSSGQGLWVYASATNQYPSSYIFPSGGAQFAGGIATMIPLVSKQAVRWFNANDITNFANGIQGTTNTAGTGTMVPTMLTIGANSTTGTAANLEWLNGCVRRVKFWPVALPDSQIIALTA